jgi:hypothetical protein
MRGMQGEITRARVTQALRSVKDMKLSMIGTRLSIGPEAAHNPNRATLPMRLGRAGGASPARSGWWRPEARPAPCC